MNNIDIELHYIRNQIVNDLFKVVIVQQKLVIYL